MSQFQGINSARSLAADRMRTHGTQVQVHGHGTNMPKHDALQVYTGTQW